MSRTDKDRPYWVRIGDPQEKRVDNHDHRPIYRLCVTGWTEHDLGTYRYTRADGYRVATSVECDIDDYKPTPSPHRWRRGSRCHYSLSRERPFWRDGAPHDFNRVYWTKPERRRERDGLRAIAREYNAGEDVEDVDFVNRQHRHDGSWQYW